MDADWLVLWAQVPEYVLLHVAGLVYCVCEESELEEVALFVPPALPLVLLVWLPPWPPFELEDV